MDMISDFSDFLIKMPNQWLAYLSVGFPLSFSLLSFSKHTSALRAD